MLPAPPVATRVFDQRETITFRAELYDNPNRSSHAVDFTTSVRAVSDGQLVFRTRDERTVEAGNTLRTEAYSGEISLKDLAPGTYVLRVEARSRTGNQFAYREVPFEVVGIPAGAMTD